MTDNTTLPGTGDVYASDDIGGVKHQRVKISIGGDGVAVDASPAASLPTTDVSTMQLLAEVLAELRVISFHLSCVSGETVTETDVS